MKCKEFRFDLPDYLNNKISEELKSKIENHLLSCDSCRNELEALRLIKADIDTFKIEEPDERYFINFLPELNREIDRIKIKKSVPQWIPKFALPFSSLAIIIILIITSVKFDNIKPYNQRHNFITREEQVEVNHDVISALPIPSEQITIQDENLLEMNNRVNEKLNEALLKTGDESLYSSDNIKSLLDELSDEDFSKIVKRLNEKQILQ